MNVAGYFKLFGFLWVFVLLGSWVMGLIVLVQRQPGDEVLGLGAMLTGCMFVGLLPGALLVAIGQGLQTLDRILFELKRRKV